MSFKPDYWDGVRTGENDGEADARADAQADDLITRLEYALYCYDCAVEAVEATAGGEDPMAATYAVNEVAKTLEVLKTLTQPEYVRQLLSMVRRSQQKFFAQLVWESLLSELIDKILPGQDSGDLRADAELASKHLDKTPPIRPLSGVTKQLADALESAIDSLDDYKCGVEWSEKHDGAALVKGCEALKAITDADIDVQFQTEERTASKTWGQCPLCHGGDDDSGDPCPACHPVTYQLPEPDCFMDQSLGGFPAYSVELVEKILAATANKRSAPLTEEQLWDLKDKHLWKAYTAREWVEETDCRSGYYKEVQRGYDDFIGFARAIEHAHGITASGEER